MFSKWPDIHSALIWKQDLRVKPYQMLSIYQEIHLEFNNLHPQSDTSHELFIAID